MGKGVYRAGNFVIHHVFLLFGMGEGKRGNARLRDDVGTKHVSFTT